MANKSTNNDYSFNDIRKIALKKRFANFNIDDGKDFHTVSEIRQAAINQGIIKPPEPVVPKSTPVQTNPYQPVQYHPSTKTGLAGIKENTKNRVDFARYNNAVEAVKNNPLGYRYLSGYDDNTRYSDVKKNLSQLSTARTLEERSGGSTDAYDKAIELLQDYANQRYSFGGADTSRGSIEGRQERYNENERKIAQLSEMSALEWWLNCYDNESIIVDGDNDYIIDMIKDETGVDITDTVGGLDSEQRAEKAEELRKQLSDFLSETSDPDISSKVAKLADENKAYERTKKAEDYYYSKYYDQAKAWSDQIISTLSDNAAKSYNPDLGMSNVDLSDSRILELFYGGDAKNNALMQPVGESTGFSAAADDVFSSNLLPSSGSDDNDHQDNNLEERIYKKAFTDHYIPSPQGDTLKTGYLTDDEKMIYSYLLNTEGVEAANNYLNEMRDVLDLRGYANVMSKAQNASTGSKALGVLSSVYGNTLGTIPGFLEDTYYTLKGEDIHPYSYAHEGVNESQIYRQVVADDIDKSTNGANIAGYSWGDAFQAAMSSVDATAAIISPEVYGAVMGMGAAQSRAKELWDQGASNEDIVLESALVGIAEGVFEKVSLEGVLKKAAEGSALKTFLAGIAAEGQEEFVTSLADMAINISVRGDQNDIAQNVQRYLDEGYSQSEAEALAFVDAAKQVGYDTVGGMIGGGLSGGAIGINYAGERAQKNKYYNSTGANIAEAGNVQELIDRAYAMDDGTKAAQKIVSQANKVNALDSKQGTGNKFTNKVNEQRTKSAAGKLYADMQNRNIARMSTAEETEVKNAIKATYSERIKADISDRSVSLVANAIYKELYTDEKLTAKEKKYLTSPAAQYTIEHVKDNAEEIQAKVAQVQRQSRENIISIAKLTGKEQTQVKSDEDVDIDDFNLSKDDQTYVKGKEDPVTTGDIVGITKDDIKVKLSDGSVESVKNLDLASTDDAVAFQSILDMQQEIGVDIPASTANIVYNGLKSAQANGYKGGIVRYIKGAQESILKGYINDSGAYSAEGLGIKLSSTTRDVFYEEGRRLSQTHTQEQQEQVKSRVTKTDSHREGKVTYKDGIKREQLDERRRAGVDAVSHLAKSLGFDVVFYRSTKDGKGRYNSKYVTDKGFIKNGQQAPSGFWRNGTMYLDVNAGLHGEGLILFTASHELVHMIREGSPADFKALADFLIDNYVKKGVDVQNLVKREMLGRSYNLTYNEAYEEMIAESCESLLRDIHIGDMSQQLYKQNPTLWGKIKNALSRIVNAVKEWYRKASPQSMEGRITSSSDTKALEKAYQLFIDAVQSSAENLRNMEKSADKGGTMMMARVEGEKNTSSLKTQLKNAQSLINQTEPVISIDSKNTGSMSKSEVATFAINEFRNKLGFGDVIVNDSIGEVEFTDKIIRTAINRYAKLPAEKSAVLAVPYVIKYGKPIDGHPNHKNRGYSSRTIAAAVEIDGVRCNMAVSVKNVEILETKNRVNRYAVHRILLPDGTTIKIIENKKDTKAALSEGFDKEVTSGTSFVFNESIPQSTDKVKRQSRDSDYLSAVESGDMQTAQRMVDEAAERAFENSAIRGEDGKLIKMYHGTDSDFTVFDIVKYGGKTGTAEGLGINLIDRKEGASGYGSRVIESYVNITKPAKTWEKTITRNDLVKLIRKSAETEAQRMVEEDEYGSVNEALKDTWISNYVNTYEYSNIEDVYKEVADTVLRYNTNDRDIVWEVVNGSGSNYSNENWIKFYNDILKPTIGIDGFWTTWAAKDGKRANVVIAFDSSQVKSADPVTYDNKGEVIPLSERFDTTKTDIRYQERGGDFFDIDDMFDDDDSIESTFAKEYATHHEDIGEVLKNIADIEIDPKKVTSIVNRVIRDNFGSIDAKARELLSTEIQIALENVNREDPETVINEMISAVRKAVVDANVTDDRAAANYSDLLSAFKGRKFYLTDEQINQLAEHDMTLDQFRRKMLNKITIVNRENVKRSIDGGYADASELSLEGLYDMLESPEEYLPFSREQWDKYGYDAPYILMETMEKLRDMRTKSVSDVYSEEDIDYLAVALTAKITGGIVEEKYKSKYNGKDSQQIRQALKEQQKRTDDYISVLVDNLTVQHEIQLAEQREKNKQKLAELKQKERARAEKREQELRAKYREQRARGYESRKRTEFRGKVKQLIGSFNTMLTHPVEGKYIPRGFVSQTIDILNAINTDSRRSEKLSAAIAELKVKYEALKADETGYASYNSAMEERLRVLSEMIEAEAEEWVPKRNKAIAYENKRAATEGKPLKRPVTTADFSIQNMSLELLQYTYETLNGMRTVIRESMRMTGEETRKMRQQITDALISEIKGVRREHTNMLTVYGNLSKSGYVMFKSFADYKKNSEWENRQNELNKGQLETSRLLIEFSKPTLELIADKKNLDNMLKTKVDIGLKDADGNPVPVTHDMLVHIYLDLSNEHNAGHVAGDGYHVPDLDLYYKGKRAKSFERATSRLASGPYIHAVELSQRMKELDVQLNTAIKNGEDTLSIENEIDKTAVEIKKLKAESDKYLSGLKKAVESKMTAYDYQWVEAWREFNDMAASAINNVTMQTLGFKKAVVDNYFPITVDKSFRAPDFDTIVSDMLLESWGSLKERVKGAKGAIVLQGITDVMADRIHKTALYCGMTIPVQNFRKVYGGTQYNFKTKQQGNDFKTSVQRELDKKFGTPTVGDSANVYIKKLVADMIESRNNSDNGTDKLLALARGGIAISTLTTNPRVWLVQAASLVSALPELDMKSVLKGTATIAYKWNPHYKQKGAATRLRMSKVTPLYDLRRMGMVDTELGDIAKQRSSKVSKAAALSQKLLNLTQKVDSLTTGRIWFMCEYWVKEHKPNLREGTIEFDKAVAEKYNQVIERTQPNYTPMQRGQILRSKNAVTKLFTMWQTQRMQNVNMLFDAVGTLNRTIYDYNHGLNNITKNDLKTARYQAGKTTLAFIVSNAMIVAIQAATDMLIYRKFKRYDDDDDELTTKSVLYGILLNYLSTLTGNFFGGSELEDMISAVITGERYNEINPGLLGTLIEDVTSVVKTAQSLKSDGVLSADFLTNLNTAITNWCGIFGIPARNVENIYDGVVGWIEKLVDKDLFQFSEIGSHVNRALNARAVNKIVNGDYSSVSVMTQDKYDEAYTKAWKKGWSEEDCQSAGRTAAKKAIANLVKETYLSTDDFETKRAIRLYMYKSGYYVVSSGKKKGQVSLDVVDNTLESWKNNQNKKENESETAKERKGK